MIYRGSGSSTCVILVSTFLLLFSIFFMFLGSTSVYGVELFAKDEEPPFGIPYDIWVSKYWNWWISLSGDEATPKPNGCLINKSESLVMPIDTAVGGTHNQICNIQSTQGILIPLWIGWCDSSPEGQAPTEPIWKCAREGSNLGNIRSEVKVDGVSVAKLDVRMSLISGSLDYKINSLDNVIELYTTDFDLVVPADTHKGTNTVAGTWRAGSHGWWVVLKPLPPGDHTVHYNVRVTPTGALTSPGTNPVFTDITYLFKVT
jgi:hypothetical protein